MPSANHNFKRNMCALIETHMDDFENDVAKHYPDFDFEKSEDHFPEPFYVSELSRRMFAAYIAGIRAEEIKHTMKNH